MALTAIETGILGILDRFAYQVKAMALAGTGGTDVWTRVDAVGDETFENRVKGVNGTALDAAILAMNLGDLPEMKTWLADLDTYCTTDAAASHINGYLTDRQLRLDYVCKDIIETLLGPNNISIANVHGPADGGAAAPGVALGDFTKGGSLVAGTALDPLLCATSAVLARVTALGVADWTLSITCRLADDTTKVIGQVISGTGAGGAVGDTYVVGRQAIGSGAASGQAIVSVAATAQFKVGQTVLITQWSGSPPNETWLEQEWGVVKTIVTNTSLELEDNLLHTYTTAGFVYPCFEAVTVCSDSGGTAGDRVYFYPAADRRLKL